MILEDEKEIPHSVGKYLKAKRVNDVPVFWIYNARTRQRFQYDGNSPRLAGSLYNYAIDEFLF